MPEILDGDLEVIKNNTIDWLSFSYYMSSLAKDGNTSIIAGGNMKVEINPYLVASEWGLDN